jgi:hypothetical protein
MGACSGATAALPGRVTAVRGYLTRDRLAVLAAALVPFRASFPNTDAAWNCWWKAAASSGAGS